SGTANDGVVGWLTLNMAHPDLSNLSTSTSVPTVAAAITAADPFVNFASYDTNHNGVIEPTELHISVVMAGYEAAYTGWQNCGPAVWGHQTAPGSSAPTADGVKVGGLGYTTFGERHCSNLASDNHQATIGIIAHETGHDLGWPDLYDTTFT